MADYRLSRKTEADLVGISIYGFENFGFRRAMAYRDELIAVVRILVEYPKSGELFSAAKPNIRRFLHGSHIIYYRISTDGIFVLRILHHAQDPLRHL